MPDPAFDFRRLKRAVPVVRFLEARGLTGGLRRRGPRLVGPCPIHHGDNPTAFVVDLDQNVWFCFTGCGGGGDVVDLVRKVDGVGYAEAARRLAAIAGLPVAASESTSFAQVSSRTCQPFRPYVHALRLDPDAPFIRAKGIAAHTAQRFEVGAWHGYGFLAGCVGVRIHDIAGRPLGYAGRRLDPDDALRHGKWKFPSGFPKSEVLYGAHRSLSRETSTVAVTECPWGVLRLAQLGIPAVALLGTSLSSVHRQHLAAARRVLILFDGDPAGRAAGQRALALLEEVTQVRVVTLPNGADPDDLNDSQLESLLRPFFLS